MNAYVCSSIMTSLSIFFNYCFLGRDEVFFFFNIGNYCLINLNPVFLG